MLLETVIREGHAGAQYASQSSRSGSRTPAASHCPAVPGFHRQQARLEIKADIRLIRNRVCMPTESLAASHRLPAPAPPRSGRPGRARRSCARQLRSTPLRPVAGNAVPHPGHTTANTPFPRTSLYFRRSLQDGMKRPTGRGVYKNETYVV